MNKYFSLFMKMSEREKFLEENPAIKQMPSATGIHSGRGLGKPDEGFRDILREMKKKHSKGITRSTINTFFKDTLFLNTPKRQFWSKRCEIDMDSYIFGTIEDTEDFI